MKLLGDPKVPTSISVLSNTTLMQCVNSSSRNQAQHCLPLMARIAARFLPKSRKSSQFVRAASTKIRFDPSVYLVTDDKFAPGTRRGATGGSPSRRLASFAQLPGHRALPLTSTHVSVRAARLSYSTPLQPGVRARDTGI